MLSNYYSLSPFALLHSLSPSLLSCSPSYLPIFRFTSSQFVFCRISFVNFVSVPITFSFHFRVPVPPSTILSSPPSLCSYSFFLEFFLPRHLFKCSPFSYFLFSPSDLVANASRYRRLTRSAVGGQETCTTTKNLQGTHMDSEKLS